MTSGQVSMQNGKHKETALLSTVDLMNKYINRYTDLSIYAECIFLVVLNKHLTTHYTHRTISAFLFDLYF